MSAMSIRVHRRGMHTIAPANDPANGRTNRSPVCRANNNFAYKSAFCHADAEPHARTCHSNTHSGTDRTADGRADR